VLKWPRSGAKLDRLAPTSSTPLQPLFADAFDVEQVIRRLLQSFERALFVDGDDLGGEFRTNAANGPGRQIFLNTFRRSWVGRLELIGFELLAVFPVNYPATHGFQMLARRDGRGTADDGNEVFSPFDLHLEDGKPFSGLW
jgi:hypothetical protein